MIRVNYEIFLLGMLSVSVVEFKTAHQSYTVTLKQLFLLFTLRCVSVGVLNALWLVLHGKPFLNGQPAFVAVLRNKTRLLGEKLLSGI